MESPHAPPLPPARSCRASDDLPLAQRKGTCRRHRPGAQGREAGLCRCLPKARRRRQQRHGRKPRSSSIPTSRSIQCRPIEVDDRKSFGHWEADLLIFRRAHGKADLTSMIER